MIFFITSNSDHPTNKAIINYFKLQRKEIPFEVLSPMNSQDFFDEKFKNLSIKQGNLIILKPDHKRIYDICNLILKYGIPSVNHAEITKLFKNRWNVEQKIKNYLEIANETGKFLQIKIPNTWYVNSSNIKNEADLQRFIKQTNTIFQEKLPLVVKYPYNHEGIHYTRKILNIEDLHHLIWNFRETGILLQDHVEGSKKILKCYSVGENAICFQSEFELSSYTENEVLSKKFTVKPIKKLIKTPNIMHEFIDFIKNFLNVDLFGCDFIEMEDMYYFIDINDFPGYQGVLNGDKILSEYFINKSLS